MSQTFCREVGILTDVSERIPFADVSLVEGIEIPRPLDCFVDLTLYQAKTVRH
jgi:hypothetical protein